MNVKASKNLIRILEQEEEANPGLHPYRMLMRIASDYSSTGPSLALRVECLQILLRCRLPILSSSKNITDGTIEHRPAPISRMQVLEALSAAPPEIRAAILSGRKLLESGEHDE